jgi:hypothetical protein
MSDDLAEGNLFVELQVSSWPPPVTQTLLRKRDARQGLTIRAKPSGRLRVELLREGYEPAIVRTAHLRLRPPGLLRLNVVWRGNEAAVAAGGSVIGTSSDFAPEGVVAPAMVQETEAPLDHVGNERARELRRRNAALTLQRIAVDEAEVGRWFAALALQGQVLADLVELVREGRRHHLPGLVTEVARLMSGEQPLLQWCAALVEAPLPVYATTEPPAHAGTADILIASAFDVAAERGPRHELAVDLDVWRRHEHAWLGGRAFPVEALLLAIDSALTTPPVGQAPSDEAMAIRAALGRSGAAIDAVCAFATSVCGLARAVAAAAPAQRS